MSFVSIWQTARTHQARDGSRSSWYRSYRTLVLSCIVVFMVACSLLNRNGPNVTCADLQGGAINACQDGIIASCANGTTVTWQVCADTQSTDGAEVCSAEWQRPGQYRCLSSGALDTATPSKPTAAPSTAPSTPTPMPSGTSSAGVNLSCRWELDSCPTPDKLAIVLRLFDYDNNRSQIGSPNGAYLANGAVNQWTCTQGHRICKGFYLWDGSQGRLLGACEPKGSSGCTPKANLSQTEQSEYCFSCAKDVACGGIFKCE